MPDNIFEIKDLSFSYGNNKVIDGLNLKIKEGRITTLIGANGCGKSTLFNLMTKNLKPNNGEIFLAGQSVEQMKLKDFARKAAIVHQYNTAPPDITVEKLVEFGRTPYHTMGLSPNPEEDREKVKFALEITNTEKFKDKPVSQLSGGQQQRCAIARALIKNPKLLLCDEPTGALDSKTSRDILILLEKINAKYGTTMLIVTHNNAIKNMVHKVIIVKDGLIKKDYLNETRIPAAELEDL